MSLQINHFYVLFEVFNNLICGGKKISSANLLYAVSQAEEAGQMPALSRSGRSKTFWSFGRVRSTAFLPMSEDLRGEVRAFVLP